MPRCCCHKGGRILGLAEGMGGRERASGKEGEASIDEWQSGFWWESCTHATGGGTGPRVEKKVDSARVSSRDCAGRVPRLPCPSRTPPRTAIWAVHDASTPSRTAGWILHSQAGGPTRTRGRWGSSPARLKLPSAKARYDCAKRWTENTVTQRSRRGQRPKVHPSLPGFG